MSEATETLPEEAPAAKPPEQPAPTVIPENERLQLINLELQVNSFSDKKQILQAKMEALNAQERLAMNERASFLNALSAKYKFDPATNVMDPQTGLVFPRQVQQGKPS